MELQKSKSLFKSKMLWANLILAVVAFFPSVQQLVSQELLLQFMAGLNIFLRLVTKDKVILFESQEK